MIMISPSSIVDEECTNADSAGSERLATSFMVRSYPLTVMEITRTRQYGANHIKKPPTGTPPRSDPHECMSFMQAYSPFSVVEAVADAGPFIAFSSDPSPLCPRFLPGMWNPKVVGDLVPHCGASLDESANREKRPFFFGLVSSLRPTSSKFSSSIESGFSKLLERMAGDMIREKRESREVRDGAASWCATGERAEMSWRGLILFALCTWELDYGGAYK